MQCSSLGLLSPNWLSQMQAAGAGIHPREYFGPKQASLGKLTSSLKVAFPTMTTVLNSWGGALVRRRWSRTGPNLSVVRACSSGPTPRLGHVKARRDDLRTEGVGQAELPARLVLPAAQQAQPGDLPHQDECVSGVCASAPSGGLIVCLQSSLCRSPRRPRPTTSRQADGSMSSVSPVCDPRPTRVPYGR